MSGDLTSNILLGLQTALQPDNLWFCFLGVLLGTIIGVVPGIGALTAIAMLFPITLHLQPTSAIIMLAGIFYGSSYGGSTASILLNVPGDPNAAATCLDGYPMARQGRAGVALTLVAGGSFIGGSVGILLMMAFSPLLASLALKFGPPEYFALMTLGLLAAAIISEGSMVKGLAMVLLGIFLGTIGTDVYTGIERFTFGSPSLTDGISMVAVTMGLFGISEVYATATDRAENVARQSKITFRSMLPTWDDIRRAAPAALRGTGVGAILGILPGAGSTIAAFMSYSLEKRLSKDPSRFGRGAVEGVTAPEAANNAADQTAFIPTLTLGIPGKPTMAIIMGALMIHGIQPGPLMLTQKPDLFWGLVMSFWVGNLLLLVLNLPLIGIWIRLLTIPYKLLFPAILVFICLGVYSVNRNPFEVWTVLAFGGLGYVMRLYGFPIAALLLGFVLGPMVEENFRRTMIIARGSPAIFIERPLSAAILVLAVLAVGIAVFSGLKRRRAAFPVAE
ncbi:tripartite tricarboxylate transporter permease [Chelatococcus asaccharovorans]|uniref:TctA family transporter n=1 Tax=Chelatococcus asaccharovorans TaxID=28210 RepID=A0A2V3UL04_9HYPH|nr:tripartite tricarboxylate transporter permease [Chelatococcus asaccharovorans]MBS7705473.1 tripartite tricarboxylate transporter permease [Chelatococcus asaccharovorans]PXW60122.1 TctA family transporter [Chelatococcus asaccharovorans]